MLTKGHLVLQYVSEIRVTIELLLTVCTLWWTIRTFVVSAATKDALLREDDDTHSHRDALGQSVKKMESTTTKIKEKIIPGQIEVMQQLVKQIENMEKNLKKSTLPSKVRLYKEVQQFYTEQPDSRYFRATDYKPGED